MTLPFTLRPFEPEDGSAFAQLLLDSPDTGRIHFTSHYQVDPYVALSVRQGDFLGIVAETPGQEGLIGAGLVRFRQAQIEGELRPSALLNTLIVHPRFRRQGIASALVEWLVRAARQRFGDEGVIWASIQRGNVGSVRTVTKFLPQMIPDRLITIPMKMWNKPPKPVPGWRVREASKDELAQVTHDRINLASSVISFLSGLAWLQDGRVGMMDDRSETTDSRSSPIVQPANSSRGRHEYYPARSVHIRLDYKTHNYVKLERP